MIDGVKLSFKQNLKNEWLANSHLHFFAKTDLQTGEQTGQLIAKHRGCRFIINRDTAKNVCRFNGSLHKFYNGGKPNNNDFNLNQIESVLNTFQTTFNVELKQTEIHALEIGLNLENINAKRFIKSAISYKGNDFSFIDIDNTDLGKIVATTDYTLKIYNKGLQSKTNKDILRVEIKYKRARGFRSIVQNLEDLQNKDNLNKLFDLLCNAVNQIIFFDFDLSMQNESNALKRELWFRYSNPNFWSKFQHQARFKARQKYYIDCQKYGAFNFLSKLLHEMNTKKETLLNENMGTFATSGRIEKRGRLPHLDNRELLAQQGQEIDEIFGGGCEQKTRKRKRQKMSFGKSAKSQFIEENLLITYCVGGAIESTLLTKSEISTSEKFIKDSVLKVVIMQANKRNKYYQGEKAKDYLLKIVNKNKYENE